MPYTLPDLPYAANALEPHFDARTMEIHHGKHHNTYVTKLNDALAGAGVASDQPIESLIADIGSLPAGVQGAVRNNGGGHANHSFFWKILGPDAGGEPGGDLGARIQSDFGSFSDFQQKFANAGATRFGSGWAWLCSDSSGALTVTSSPNQDSPLMGSFAGLESATPILGLDVWEHAYYLNYQNRRPDYIAAFWNVVNWDAVAANYAAAQS